MMTMIKVLQDQDPHHLAHPQWSDDTLPDHITLQHVMMNLLVINWTGRPLSGGE